MNKLYVPETNQDLIDTANLLTNNDGKAAFELILNHASFGHHFGGHMGLVLVNCVTIKGKPTMRADALAGICRNSGLVRRLQVVNHNEKVCVIECERSDEPTGVVHTFEFTWQMAEQMGLTRNSNWSRMPRQMLRARCVAMACRAVWPDAVSGIYTADEMADSLDLSDRERFEITTQSLGEDDVKYEPSNRPQPQRPPQPSRPPQRKAAPQPQPQPKQMARSKYDFSSEQAFWAVVADHGISAEEVRGVCHRLSEDVSTMSPSELSEFFYTHCLFSTRRLTHIPDEWWALPEDKSAAVHDGFKSENPCLTLFEPAFYGPRLSHPAWVETMRHLNHVTNDEQRSEGVNVLKQMSPDDWSAYDYLVSLSAG